MNILLTGGTGLVGSNILPLIKEKYCIFAPKRKELDLLNQEAVEEYVKVNKIEIIIHCANPNGVKNSIDKDVNMVEGSLRCFMNFYRLRNMVKKILYLGSGAEFDKTLDIKLITEEELGRSLPHDEYGFAKYIMNELARASDNVYNMRIFACYGPGDYYTKFITHCINTIMNQEKELTINQDCYFDYMQVNDLAKVLEFFIDNKPAYHDYNVCTGTRYKLSDIAKLVMNEMNVNLPIVFRKDGLNNEYTGCNSRLLSEIGKFDFTSLEEGIKIQINSMKEEGK